MLSFVKRKKMFCFIKLNKILCTKNNSAQDFHSRTRGVIALTLCALLDTAHYVTASNYKRVRCVNFCFKFFSFYVLQKNRSLLKNKQGRHYMVGEKDKCDANIDFDTALANDMLEKKVKGFKLSSF